MGMVGMVLTAAGMVSTLAGYATGTNLFFGSACLLLYGGGYAMGLADGWMRCLKQRES